MTYSQSVAFFTTLHTELPPPYTHAHNRNEKEPHQVTLLHCTFTCKKNNVCTDLRDNLSNSC